MVDYNNEVYCAGSGSGSIVNNTIDSESKDVLSVLHEKRPEIIHGEVIGKIAGSFYYVVEDTSIEELSDLLLRSENINVVGIVSETGEITGIISKEYLANMLSKAFGRELFINKPVKIAAKKVNQFNFNRNIFSVADEISSSLNIEKIKYYILHDDSMKFAGIFSSDDLLMYLSEMTQRDISMAKRLQSFIVKEEQEIQSRFFSFLGASKMARGVGGDYYLVKNYSENRYLFALCDVSGKGMAASLLSVLLDGMLNVYDFQKGVENFIVALNSYVFNTFMLEKYITGVFIDFDEKTGSLTIYDMGHSYTYLIRDKRFIKLKMKNRDFPIGIAAECSPRGNKFKLTPGDLLMLFSDGIEEQKNPMGAEFGISRLADIVSQNSHKPIGEIKNRVLDEIENFRGNQTQLDDITMVFINYHGDLSGE